MIFLYLVRFIVTLARSLVDKAVGILYRNFTKETTVLPRIENKILLMPATLLAENIRKKKIKCEDVIGAYIRRIAEVQPIINAVVDQRYEAAMKEAIAIDRMIASEGKSEQDIARDTPLLGVPFSCKEAIGVKGLAQTCGLVHAKDRKAGEDAESVSNYRKAGAIPMIVTNVPELCLWWNTANHAFGATNNPYDNSRLVGGSSGGEGAIITSAGAVMGIGNDLGGSIRIPSNFCGIYGHKPSKGLISNKGMWPECSEEFDKFVSTGPMCRFVEDLPSLVKVLAGDNARFVPFDEKVDFRKVQIYYMEEFPGFLLSATSDVKAAVRKSVEHFKKEFNSSTTKIHVKELKYAFEIWAYKMLEAGELPILDAMKGSDGQDINLVRELFKNICGCSEHTLQILYYALCCQVKKDDAFYGKAVKMFDSIRKKFEEILQGDAILLLPSHPEPPTYNALDIPKFPNIAYTAIFNILGYASTQIPAGQSNGLPIGVQAVGSQYKDHLTLAAAGELDKVFKGWIPPCPVSSKI